MPAATGMELATAYVSILPSTRGFAPQLSKQLSGASGAASGAGRTAGEKFASGFGTVVDKLGTYIKRGILAGGAVATAAGAIGIKTAAELETANIAFTTMLGSGKKAQAFLDQLADFAAKTPFDLPGLQKSAQSLISIGIDSKKVIPIMTTLGNVTSGMGTGAEGINRATIAIQQMNAAGRITAEDLNQLRDAGIPVYDLLTAATGKTTAEVAKMAQTGKLGKKELDAMMKALETGKGLERFAGMMDKQSKSLTGIWSTLKDTFSVGIAKSIEPLIPLIKDGLNTALSVLETTILPGIKTGLDWLMVNGPIIWTNITTGVTDATKWIKDHETQIKIVAGVMTALLLPAIVRGTVSLTAQAAAWALAKAQAATSGLVYAATSYKVVAAWVVMGAAAIKSGAQTAAIWLMYRMDSAKAVAAMVAAKLAVVKNWIAMGAAAVASGLKTAAVWTAQIAKSAAAGAASFALSAAKVVGRWVFMGAQALIHAAKMAAGWVIAMGPIGWVTAAVIGIAALIWANWDKIKRWTVDLWGKAGDQLAKFRDFIVQKLTPVITWLYDHTVKPIWDKIGGKLTGVWKTLIKPMFDVFMSILKGDFPGAFKKATDMVDKHWNALKKIASKPVDFVVNTVINKGLIGTFNKIARVIPGIGELPEVNWKGFATGGWTGHGAKHQPAGVVHADEYVLRKEAQQSLRRAAPGFLDNLNRYGARALGYASGGLVNPMPPQYRRVSAGWHGYPGHLGTDYPAPVGTSVYSPGDGYVANVGWNLSGGTGKQVWIQHTNGLLSRVHHLSQWLVKVGEKVRAGEAVGRVGMTGRTTGPHAHWGVMDGKRYLNPATVWGTGLGGSGGGGGGPLGFIGDIMGLATKAKDMFAGKFENAGFMLKAAKGVGTKLLSSAGDWLMDKIGSIKDAVGDFAGSVGSKVKWTPLATQALWRTHNFGPRNLASLLARMEKESGFNPRAVNNWDSNAKRGTPSKGLMQVIQPTFDAYRDRSLPNDIFDPLANVVAAINYTKARYGNLRKGWNRPGGYAMGGLVTPTLFDGGGWLHDTGGPQIIDHRRRKPDAVLTNQEFADLHKLATAQTTGGGNIHIDQVVIPASDLAELKDVTEFFDALRRKARQR